jgi:hypothetical protein
LHQVFSSPPPRPAKRGQNRSGDAPIERLPTEILSKPFLVCVAPLVRLVRCVFVRRSLTFLSRCHHQPACS